MEEQDLSRLQEFAELFERLAPDELDHFSKLFFAHFNKIIPHTEGKAYLLKRDDMREVITQTMQAVHAIVANKLN